MEGLLLFCTVLAPDLLNGRLFFHIRAYPLLSIAVCLSCFTIMTALLQQRKKKAVCFLFLAAGLYTWAGALQEGAHLFALSLRHPKAKEIGFVCTMVFSMAFRGRFKLLLFVPFFLLFVLLKLLPFPIVSVPQAVPLAPFCFLPCFLLLPAAIIKLPGKARRKALCQAILLLLLFFVLQGAAFSQVKSTSPVPLLQVLQARGIGGYRTAIAAHYAGALLRCSCAWHSQSVWAAFFFSGAAADDPLLSPDVAT